MKECAEHFYDGPRQFNEKLHSNPNLLGFTNGVYDLDSGEFRDGQPEDCISNSTRIEYREFDLEDSLEKCLCPGIRVL